MLRVRAARTVVVDRAVLGSEPAGASVGRGAASSAAAGGDAGEDYEEGEDRNDDAGEEDPAAPGRPGGVAVGEVSCWSGVARQGCGGDVPVAIVAVVVAVVRVTR